MSGTSLNRAIRFLLVLTICLTHSGLTPAKAAALDASLLKTLVELSDNNGLKPTPLQLAFTRAQVALVGATADGTLTFKAGSGQTAPLQWKNLKFTDIATIAMLVAQLKSDSEDAQAMAGVCLERIGRVADAEAYYEKAGEASSTKLTQLFD